MRLSVFQVVCLPRNLKRTFYWLFLGAADAGEMKGGRL